MSSEAPQVRLEGVLVRELFGLYTFDIRVPRARQREPTLLILYGDNGTGKTTILNLIYHLLGREDNRGHRSYLAKVPFRDLQVRLSGGIVLEASRSGKELVGSYRLRVGVGKQTIAEAEAIASADLSVSATTSGTVSQRAAWARFLTTLQELNMSFFMLGADRRSERAGQPEGNQSPDDLELELIRRTAFFAERDRDRSDVDVRLEQTVERLETWIRDEALKATNVGEAGASNVYADVAKRLGGRGQSNQARVAEIEQSLIELDARSRPFAALGFVSAPNLAEIVATLDSAPPNRRQLIANVISPYLDGLSKRLEALQELQELVTLLLERVNSFFRSKSVTFQIGSGFSIVTPNGVTLTPSQLSSGERQLFALFGQVVTARRTASIFLIDEPEISLNVKWQRLLVDTLLDLVQGTGVQFVLATHSLELLATHREHVFRLSPASASHDGD
jgi:energy-coupling factor transporter ATP-binding protein EcfA2